MAAEIGSKFMRKLAVSLTTILAACHGIDRQEAKNETAEAKAASPQSCSSAEVYEKVYAEIAAKSALGGDLGSQRLIRDADAVQAVAKIENPTVDHIDTETGHTSCSADLRLSAGPLAGYMQVPKGLEATRDAESITFRIRYEVQQAADSSRLVLRLQDAPTIADVAWHAAAVKDAPLPRDEVRSSEEELDAANLEGGELPNGPLANGTGQVDELPSATGAVGGADVPS